MPNSYFQFKQFTIHQDKCSMKVTTDACLFGAWAADSIKDFDVKNILDIGCGTGLLSLMVAQQSAASIEGVELQRADFLQSLENIQSSVFKERIHISNANALQFTFSKKYDVIICNPPFYEKDLKSASASKNISHHNGGLTLVALISLITKLLEKNGVFFLLIPSKREKDLEEIIKEHDLFITESVYVHQTQQHAAFRLMVKISLHKTTDIRSNKIIIKNNDTYSEKFVELLQPYYLNL